MTDREKLIKVFKELDIPLTTEGWPYKEGTDDIVVSGGERWEGWSDFFFSFKFDDAGKLIEYGAWE